MLGKQSMKLWFLLMLLVKSWAYGQMLSCNQSGKVLDRLTPQELELVGACNELGKDVQAISRKLQSSDEKLIFVGYEAWKLAKSKSGQEKAKQVFEVLQRQMLEARYLPISVDEGKEGSNVLYGTIFPMGPAYLVSLSYFRRGSDWYFLVMVFSKSPR